MITLLATLVGFISSIAPEILKIWKYSRTSAPDLQSQLSYNRIQKDLNNNCTPDFISNNDKSGVSWVDGFNATVRPVLAYSFFGLYGTIKIVKFFSINHALPIIKYIDILWTPDDQAIFASIISFYFGQRTFAKTKK